MDYTGRWEQVESIEYERTDIFYDLHVPVAEHYLAEGIWHHNTGKSIACLNKLYACCDKYPDVRALICRKTRESITQSALVSWEDKVVPKGHPCLRGADRASRKEYRFPNGSKVIVGGLRQSSRDNSQQIMSTEYDIVYIQEAIELSEDDWEKITTRLRNNKMPYQQIIADTNPSAPTHWLKKRCDKGTTRILESRHSDNPMLWDTETNDWTEFGRKYIKSLDDLTGARKQRLRHGRWVQAEGVVWENWDAAVHVIPRFEIPKDWRRIRSVDFGYTHPLVVQWWALDPDGRMYLYREYVQTRMTVDEHGPRIKSLSPDGEFIEANVCDHDEENRATLEKWIGPTTSARKEVIAGIQCVEQRLKVQPDGKPRMFVFDDALVGIDQDMEDAKKPIGLSAEIDSYIWDARNLDNPKEVPLKINDDSCDAARYAAMYFEEGAWVPPVSMGQKEYTDPAKDWRSSKKGNWRNSSGSINWRLRDQV